MIELIEALNYRSLRYIRLPLAEFHLLVGPNASGKTTLFDTLGFLRDLLHEGLQAAISRRVKIFEELLHQRTGETFELAVEMRIPPARGEKVSPSKPRESVRYEIAIGFDASVNEYAIQQEQVLLIPKSRVRETQGRLRFPEPPEPPPTIIRHNRGTTQKLTFRKNPGGNDNFYDETVDSRQGGWAPSFRLGPRKSGLANLPDDESKFPVTTWLRETLRSGVQTLALNSLELRQPSAPGRGLQFLPDGSNLPWVIDALEKDPDRHRDWLELLRTALPDIRNVTTGQFPDTLQRYVLVEYVDGLRIPSWTVSDGTLRILALTLPGYLTSFEGVYLIEEPENGIHPRAMETVYQALRQVDSAQILLATHSPVLLGCATPAEILCFSKAAGATDIVSGVDHPRLKDWKGDFDLATLYASGVLG
jgi:predicted ATPase